MKGKKFLKSLALMMAMTMSLGMTVSAAEVTVTDGSGQSSTTVTGTVSTITTIDVTVPIGGVNLAIDEDGNITSQGVVVTSNTAVPLTINVLSVEALEAGDVTNGLAATTIKAPALVPVGTYTADAWNNLNKSQTAEKIAIALKQVDVVDGNAGSALSDATTDALKVATPVQLGSLAENSKLAHLESGYGTASSCAINLETDVAYTNYGKAWANGSDVTFRYLTTLEFVLDN